jgi:hypothetical protein
MARFDGKSWLLFGDVLGEKIFKGKIPLFRRVSASWKFDQCDHIGLDVIRDFRIGL